jgi:hypothetical protein
MTQGSSTLVNGRVGLYWGPRQKPFADCSRDVLASLSVLKEKGFEKYFHGGRRRGEVMKREVAVEANVIEALLTEGADHGDGEAGVDPELGWSLSLWSGDPAEAYSVSFVCGAYSAWARNSVTVVLPTVGPRSLATDSARAVEIYEAFVAIWQPEQAVVCQGDIEWTDGRLTTETEPLVQLGR